MGPMSGYVGGSIPDMMSSRGAPTNAATSRGLSIKAQHSGCDAEYQCRYGHDGQKDDGHGTEGHGPSLPPAIDTPLHHLTFPCNKVHPGQREKGYKLTATTFSSAEPTTRGDTESW